MGPGELLVVFGGDLIRGFLAHPPKDDAHVLLALGRGIGPLGQVALHLEPEVA